MIRRVIATIAFLVGGAMLESALGQTPQKRVVVQPDSARFVEVVNGTTEIVDYRGRRAVKLVPSPETAGKNQDMMAILAGNQFKDGTIEVDVIIRDNAGNLIQISGK